MKPLQILLISAPLVLAGCSSLKVTPATEHATSGEVCITPDMSGRKVAYQCTIKALQHKGFTVREVSQAECRDCRVVLHCQTTSRWDLANFTSDINYEWIEDGKTIAKANTGSVRISVSGEVIPGAAQRGCPLYLRCSMPDLMR